MMRVINAKNAKMIKILDFADARKKKKKKKETFSGRAHFAANRGREIAASRPHMKQDSRGRPAAIVLAMRHHK